MHIKEVLRRKGIEFGEDEDGRITVDADTTSLNRCGITDISNTTFNTSIGLADNAIANLNGVIMNNGAHLYLGGNLLFRRYTSLFTFVKKAMAYSVPV